VRNHLMILHAARLATKRIIRAERAGPLDASSFEPFQRVGRHVGNPSGNIRAALTSVEGRREMSCLDQGGPGVG
jgi:hypothetical protein